MIPDWLNEILGQEFFGNSLFAYLTFLVVVGLGFAVLQALQKYLIHWLHKLATRTESRIDDYVVEAFKRIRKTFLLVISIYHAQTYISLPGPLKRLFDFLILATVVVQIAILMGHFVSSLLQESLGRGGRAVNVSAVNNLTLLAKLGIWIAALLFFFDNLGIDVKTMIAGLGVGGVAVALAAQSILGDVFSSFTIYIDKPFEVGDLVEVNGVRGIVEDIGLKTTRIRHANGEVVVLPNSQMTSNMLRNLQKIKNRRYIFTLGFTYDTPAAKLAQVPHLIAETAKTTAKCTVERVQFKSFAAYSLDFDVVLVIDEQDGVLALEIQHQFNLRLKELLDRDQFSLAFPTQTVLVAKTV